MNTFMKMSNLRSIKSLQSLRPSSLIAPEDIISLIVDQNFVSVILAEISAHYLQMKCIGNNSYMESTTVLSDKVSSLIVGGYIKLSTYLCTL